MTGSDKMNLIISALVGGVLIIMALVLLSGRGSFLIAGYNTMPREKKETYDGQALCRFMGKILLPIGILVPLLGIDKVYFKTKYMGPVFMFITLGLSIFAIIYANTGNRFRK